MVLDPSPPPLQIDTTSWSTRLCLISVFHVCCIHASFVFYFGRTRITYILCFCWRQIDTTSWSTRLYLIICIPCLLHTCIQVSFVFYFGPTHITCILCFCWRRIDTTSKLFQDLYSTVVVRECSAYVYICSVYVEVCPTVCIPFLLHTNVVYTFIYIIYIYIYMYVCIYIYCICVCVCVYVLRLSVCVCACVCICGVDAHILGRIERWGAGVETQKNVRGEIGGWGRVPFNEPYAPSLSTIYDGA